MRVFRSESELKHVQNKFQEMHFILRQFLTTVRVNGSNKVKEVSGDLQRLIEYFGYTLEVGHSWNPKINRNPKTIKAFISAVQKASDIQYGSTYIREIYELLN